MSRDLEAGDELERALRLAHRCPPRCAGCRAYRAGLRPLDLLDRFADLVAGESGWRYARAHAEHGLPFPVFSSDPHEQFLVCEALTVLYEASRQHAERSREESQLAQEEARRRLDAHRGVTA